MSSPFPPNANLRLKTTGTTSLDEYGNVENVEIEIEMSAYVRQANPSRDVVLGWESQEEVPIRGFAIAPNQFPATFRPFSIADGTIDGINVRVRLVPMQLSPWYKQAEITGQKFTGAILRPTVWGNTA